MKINLALLCQDYLNTQLAQKWAAFEPIQVAQSDLEQLQAEILITDFSSLQNQTLAKHLTSALVLNKIKKVVSIFESDDERLPIEIMNQIKPDLIQNYNLLQAEDFFNLWDSIKLAEQNLAYINLSSELNTVYEDIKNELETKINDKTKNLIESRRKVFEVNSRIEFLRKILYTISEIKSFAHAEEKLNSLLTSYNKVTWFKIMNADLRPSFEKDIQQQFDSTMLRTEISLLKNTYYLYFFKGDKKPFKKSDIHLFKKLSETLQNNLSRISNLQSLQKNENFFDLAFHSSKNQILVIDNNFNVVQANKAALKDAQITKGTPKKCYELLFGLTSKCLNCQLGTQFEMQNNNLFYKVHSHPLIQMEQEDTNYWVHVYEDSTEQNVYEKKISQFARLEELGLISSSIAHELNNPLGGILSYIQIMKMELPAQHALINDLNMMHETALRMKKIIEDLLIFSRTNQKLNFETVDLYLLIQDALNQVELQLKVEKIKISFNPPSERIEYSVSKTLFKDALQLVLLFFIQKTKAKKLAKQNFISLVEVKISFDQSNYYISLAANLGPLENEFKTKDLNLLAVEKNLTDQGFQLFISEPAKEWIQFSILLPQIQKKQT